MLGLVDKSLVENCLCTEVTEAEALELVQDTVPQMTAILLTEDGRGLAAPQVGILKKFFIAKDFGMEPLFNCKYIQKGSVIQVEEACLTYGKDKFCKVKRFKSIIAMYDKLVDGKLVHFRETLSNDAAIVFQHECDHSGRNPGQRGRTIFMK